ncbi:hypothetical protein M2444_006798 [Paenibacillus sp. PastF-3]|nr:hypothetical protein [Paenibacillus sp. PastF-3]
MNLDVTFGDFDDVPKLLCGISEIGESKIKKWLNDKVAVTMRYEHLCAIDKEKEIEGCL